MTQQLYTFTRDVAVSILLYFFTRGPHHSEVNRMFGRKRSAQSALMMWWADFFWDNYIWYYIVWPLAGLRLTPLDAAFSAVGRHHF